MKKLHTPGTSEILTGSSKQITGIDFSRLDAILAGVAGHDPAVYDHGADWGE